MRGWLVNDQLTCIPGTETFWHDLLNWIPGLEDKTGGYTPFHKLAASIERQANFFGAPDYIVRNGSYFGPIDIDSKTISLIQDISLGGPLRIGQLAVGDSSDLVIFNSEYTRSLYGEISVPTRVIPLGVDFDRFSSTGEREDSVLPNSILFVGAANIVPKGFDILKELVDCTDHNFCLVMKDNFRFEFPHPRVVVFNKVSHDRLVKIYNSCSMIVCTSTVETQHLAGIEAAACGLPVIACDVGAYSGLISGAWGEKAIRHTDSYVEAIDLAFSRLDSYSPREYFLSRGYSIPSCMESWANSISEVCDD